MYVCVCMERERKRERRGREGGERERNTVVFINHCANILQTFTDPGRNRTKEVYTWINEKLNKTEIDRFVHL